jgi:hypothetical protein
MADIEGRIDLWLDRWLLFATFHDSPVGLQSNQGVDQDAYREAGAGLGVGRRLALGTAALDVALVPSLVAMRVEADLPQDEGASDVELRIGANVRLSLPLSRGWFLSITADTDIVPNGLTSALRVDPLPVPFPSWTGGLRLGASGALM